MTPTAVWSTLSEPVATLQDFMANSPRCSRAIFNILIFSFLLPIGRASLKLICRFYGVACDTPELPLHRGKKAPQPFLLL